MRNKLPIILLFLTFSVFSNLLKNNNIETVKMQQVCILLYKKFYKNERWKKKVDQKN